LKQIQNFRRNSKIDNKSNELGPVIEYLSVRKYEQNRNINPNDAIEYKSVIKTGTELNRLFIFLSSVTLMMFMKVIES
jgi:hypothetical protein